jgi:hypothetical protein
MRKRRKRRIPCVCGHGQLSEYQSGTSYRGFDLELLEDEIGLVS